MISGLSVQHQEEFERVASNPDMAVQTFFRIKDLSGQVVPFRYNRAQRLVAERSKGSRFQYVLKARKVGVSSRRFALDLWACATQKYQHRLLLTHTDEAADKLLSEKITPLLDNCLIPLGGKVKVSAGLIEFPATSSRYYVGTAGSRKFGRGDDVTGAHFSEYAHWEKPDVVNGIEEALTENADILIETTANGPNFAKADWERSKRSENRYRAIFIPWTAHEAYSADYANLGVISEEEQRLRSVGVTPGQIAWRRQKLIDMRDPRLFPQEYPLTDDEAFLSSGRPVFDPIALLQARAKISPAAHRGNLIERSGRIEFCPDPRGELEIWKVPDQNHVYGIGGDIAEGLEHGAYSAAEVIDLGEGEQVAEWHGHIAPDRFADILDLLSRWYHQAMIIPEAWPGPGGTTTSHLLQKRANVWRDPEKNEPGFSTTSASKPLMVREFASAIRDSRITIRSSRLLSECQSFVYTPKGGMEPSLGNWSDCLMAMGIAWYCSRDLASRVNYYRAPTRDGVSKALLAGTSVPKFHGPRPGVRPKD